MRRHNSKQKKNSTLFAVQGPDGGGVNYFACLVWSAGLTVWIVSCVLKYTEEKLGQAEKTELDAHLENLITRADCTKNWTEKIFRQTEVLLQPNPSNNLHGHLMFRIWGHLPKPLFCIFFIEYGLKCVALKCVGKCIMLLKSPINMMNRNICLLASESIYFNVTIWLITPCIWTKRKKTFNLRNQMSA